jgi:hypothetical protein
VLKMTTDNIMMKISCPVSNFFMILARQTGCFAPGCKFNVGSTDVLLSFRPMAENSSHPLGGW